MDQLHKLSSLSIPRDEQPVATKNKPLALILIILLSVGGAIAFGIWFFRPSLAISSGDGLSSQSMQRATVPTQTGMSNNAATIARNQSGLLASGYVIARRSATVSSEITGRLTEVLFEEGTNVEAGQVLARLDSELARYDLDLARSNVVGAHARVAALMAELEAADAQRRRHQDLVESGAVSRAALDSAVSSAETLIARIAAARADAVTAEVTAQRQAEFVSRHTIRAPFSGIVIAKNAQTGEILSPSSAGGSFTRTGIATLVDMQSLEVEVDVNEGQIANIRAGQAASIVLDAYSDWRVPGRVVAIIPTANRDRATIQVRVGFDAQDTRILPEMAAKVTFERIEN